MSEWISGKEAAIAYLNGKDVLHVAKAFVNTNKWAYCDGMAIDDFKNDEWAFKIKPETITINGIDVDSRTQIAICGTSKTIEISFANMDDLNELYNSMFNRVNGRSPK